MSLRAPEDSIPLLLRLRLDFASDNHRLDALDKTVGEGTDPIYNSALAALVCMFSIASEATLVFFVTSGTRGPAFLEIPEP